MNVCPVRKQINTLPLIQEQPCTWWQLDTKSAPTKINLCSEHGLPVCSAGIHPTPVSLDSVLSADLGSCIALPGQRRHLSANMTVDLLFLLYTPP
jgi:hypothetical protein